MDAFSLKKDNRKKFQDKEKLKRKHATPSDRKYRSLNKKAEAEAQAAEEEKQSMTLESNEHRYTSELLEEPDTGSGDEQIAVVTAKIKEILLTKGDEQPFLKSTTPQDTTRRFTKKQLENMSVSELNELLLNRTVNANELPSKSKIAPLLGSKSFESSYGGSSSDDKNPVTTTHNNLPLSHIPTPLKEDESFLDSII